ncbi:MAG: hypothetical protein E6Q36_06830 [Chryseobacterium sp.]|nr:MAG: hypothetical protein E6Q36_06830 [Chryseobacterium sp.]
METMNTDFSTTTNKSDAAEKLVVTITGQECPRKECRKIGEFYYKLGDYTVKDSGDCYLIPELNKVYRASNNNLIWSYSANRYVIKTDEIFGVVGAQKEDVIKGYFKMDNSRYSLYYDCPETRECFIIMPGIFDEISQYLVYYPHTMRYRHVKHAAKNQDLRNLMEAGHRKQEYMLYPGEYYSASESPYMVRAEKDRKLFKIHPLDKYFAGKTIGVEVETSGGSVPVQTLVDTGMVPLKDGSIAGHEYVSTIMQKDIINRLIAFFNEAAKYTVVNQYCSLHYHIGGLQATPLNVVALYMLWFRLQNETDSMMPGFKRDLGFLASKKGGAKDHCKQLPDLQILERIEIGEPVENIYHDILMLFNDNTKPTQKAGGTYVHVNEGRPKWEQHGRYHAINFIPWLFENKKTVEFRLHSGTVNKYKAIYWLLICMAFIRYVETSADKVLNPIEKLRLADVIKTSYSDNPALVEALMVYISERKKSHRDGILINDMYMQEFALDYIYTPTIQII